MSWVSLGEITRPSDRRAGTVTELPVYSVTKHRGFVPSLEYFKKQVFSRNVDRYKVVNEGEFAYATIHLDEGSIGVAPECCLVSPMYSVFKVDAARVDSRFLLGVLKAPAMLARFSSLGSGSAERRRSIRFSQLASLRVWLPPLEEQRRIADVLDRADALRAKRRETLARLDELSQSIFADMFGGDEHASLVSATTRITDGTHQSPQWSDAGVPFLFVSNIVSGEIDLETTRHVSVNTWSELTGRCPVEVGDVLYTTVGSYGVPALVRTSDRFAFQRHIAHLKPNREVVRPEFLRAALASPETKRQADRLARGIAQKTVNLAAIRQFTIPLPSLMRQDQFVTAYESARAAMAASRVQLALLDELFASLQQRAFRGDLFSSPLPPGLADAVA